jgi:hypothetical protein
MTEPTHVILDVREDGASTLKLDWGTPASAATTYHVQARRLTDAAKGVRACLEDLITSAMNRCKAKEPMTVGLELKRLAEAGHALRNAIFFSVPGPPDEGPAEKTRKEWFPNLGEVAMHVRVTQEIYIPWGLAYEGDPALLSEDPEEISIDKFSDFWCLKYHVSTLYNRIPDSVVRKPRATHEAQIVKLINEGAWTKAFEQVSGPEQRLVAAMFTGSSICSTSEFREVWVKGNRNMETDLLYFFGHANGAALEFKKGDVLTLKLLPNDLRRSPPKEHPACLVFLNGCHTAIGCDELGGFMEATAYGGYCGFVGTEAKVPDVFALRFANAFLGELLYTGKKAIQVMDKIRLDYWPLSLAYNLSCHPDFRFIAKDVSAPPMPDPDCWKDVIGSERV